MRRRLRSPHHKISHTIDEFDFQGELYLIDLEVNYEVASYERGEVEDVTLTITRILGFDGNGLERRVSAVEEAMIEAELNRQYDADANRLRYRIDEKCLANAA